MQSGQAPDELANAIAAEFRRAVREARPDLGLRLTLFGSRARGDAEIDSDVDILVEVDIERIDSETYKRLSNIAADLSLKHGVVVSLLVLDLERARSRDGFPFLRSIREEGIVA